MFGRLLNLLVDDMVHFT